MYKLISILLVLSVVLISCRNEMESLESDEVFSNNELNFGTDEMLEVPLEIKDNQLNQTVETENMDIYEDSDSNECLTFIQSMKNHQELFSSYKNIIGWSEVDNEGIVFWNDSQLYYSDFFNIFKIEVESFDINGESNDIHVLWNKANSKCIIVIGLYERTGYIIYDTIYNKSYCIDVQVDGDELVLRRDTSSVVNKDINIVNWLRDDQILIILNYYDSLDDKKDKRYESPWRQELVIVNTESLMVEKLVETISDGQIINDLEIDRVNEVIKCVLVQEIVEEGSLYYEEIENLCFEY